VEAGNAFATRARLDVGPEDRTVLRPTSTKPARSGFDGVAAPISPVI